jgi:hypothetical protein
MLPFPTLTRYELVYSAKCGSLLRERIYIEMLVHGIVEK